MEDLGFRGDGDVIRYLKEGRPHVHLCKYLSELPELDAPALYPEFEAPEEGEGFDAPRRGIPSRIQK